MSEVVAPRRRFSEIAAPSPAIYLLRTAQQHHQAISTMADRKANILITVSSIVLTLVMANVREPTLRYGLLTLGAFTLVSLIFAVLTILPRLPDDGPSPDDPSSNLLFFGHFAQLDEGQFLDRLDRVLADQSLTFEAMAHDLYSPRRLPLRSQVPTAAAQLPVPARRLRARPGGGASHHVLAGLRVRPSSGPTFPPADRERNANAAAAAPAGTESGRSDRKSQREGTVPLRWRSRTLLRAPRSVKTGAAAWRPRSSGRPAATGPLG
jgi:hypothetical protein